MAALAVVGRAWLSWGLGARPAYHRRWRQGAARAQVAGPHGAAGHIVPGGLGGFGVLEEDRLVTSWCNSLQASFDVSTCP